MERETNMTNTVKEGGAARQIWLQVALNGGTIWLAKSWFQGYADEVNSVTMHCRVWSKDQGKWERNKSTRDRLRQFPHQLYSARPLGAQLLTLINISVYTRDHQMHPHFFFSFTRTTWRDLNAKYTTRYPDILSTLNKKWNLTLGVFSIRK